MVYLFRHKREKNVIYHVDGNTKKEALERLMKMVEEKHLPKNGWEEISELSK